MRRAIFFLNAGLVLAGFMIFLSLQACSGDKSSAKNPKARIFQTSREGDLLTEKGTLTFSKDSDSQHPVIRINPNQTFQKILGFGGAFTESTAYVLNQLSKAKRDEVIQAYFSPDGAAYTLTRTHINSCDFSLGNYAYANVPGDVQLAHFSIQEDKDDLIPLIKDAMAVKGADFDIIASPWTAPPWMKDNNAWNAGSLLKKYYPTWALFFSKYLQAYQKEGIDIWGITVENEPLGNGGNWESMHFTPEEMAGFVKNHLGPQLEKDNLNPDIMIYDQNRDHLKEWVDVILGDPEVAKYVAGTAIHWYRSTYEWFPDTLQATHSAFPNKYMLQTEACVDAEVPVWQDNEWYWKKEATDWGYDWAKPENKYLHTKYAPVFRYARDIIGCLNNWVTGWVDWNMVLDNQGGPNHAKNWCIAPVIVKPETDEVYYTPLYYVMSHFSKFIRPNAYRIGVESDVKDLMVTACQNPDKSIAIAVFNQTETPVSYQIKLNEQLVEITIPQSALQTIIIQL